MEDNNQNFQGLEGHGHNSRRWIGSYLFIRSFPAVDGIFADDLRNRHAVMRRMKKSADQVNC